MKPAAAQLALDLPGAPRFGAEDFLVSPSNAAAYAVVEAWPAWPHGVQLLVGPEGSGKSHLAAIWAARAGARSLGLRSLAQADLGALAATPTVVLEDADAGAIDEEAAFHFLERVRAGGTTLICARRKPDAWGLRTADLLSRLRLAPVAEIAPPDDALLRAVLVKLLVDRQIVVDTSLVDYLVVRIERSFAAARAAVERLDREALARGRRVTRALAAEVLSPEAAPPG